jgi:hypothetical protein
MDLRSAKLQVDAGLQAVAAQRGAELLHRHAGIAPTVAGSDRLGAWRWGVLLLLPARAAAVRWLRGWWHSVPPTASA